MNMTRVIDVMTMLKDHILFKAQNRFIRRSPQESIFIVKIRCSLSSQYWWRIDERPITFLPSRGNVNIYLWMVCSWKDMMGIGLDHTLVSLRNSVARLSNAYHFRVRLDPNQNEELWQCWRVPRALHQLWFASNHRKMRGSTRPKKVINYFLLT